MDEIPLSQASDDGRLAGIDFENDSLGEAASVLVDTSVYTESEVFKAAYWYTDRYYLFLSRDGGGRKYIRIEIRPKLPVELDQLTNACREFCNALIDYRVRRMVLAETSTIRDTLLRKAFGEGYNHLDPAKLGSDETRVPEGRQSFREDALDIGHPTGAD